MDFLKQAVNSAQGAGGNSNNDNNNNQQQQQQGGDNQQNQGGNSSSNNNTQNQQGGDQQQDYGDKGKPFPSSGEWMKPSHTAMSGRSSPKLVTSHLPLGLHVH